jgi:glutamyl-tRNA synthetase/glutamyl-Q tRNA(Asp) synthetase
VNAVYVWGVARALGGRVILRIEDHDRIRSRPEFERAILEDLDWLGFIPDEGGEPVLRQSDTPGIHEAALERLRRTAHVYACDCSRKAIGSGRYSGRCRTRAIVEDARHGLRVEVGPGVERTDDLALGRLEQVPADQCGDILLRDRDGNWTYQFAVTVDDYRQGITLVVRGADLVSSTGRQIALARMLGRTEPPVFLHHPLILTRRGEKLSKSRSDTGVRELRRAGVPAAEVIGRAAAAVGLIESPHPLEAGAVSGLFG